VRFPALFLGALLEASGLAVRMPLMFMPDKVVAAVIASVSEAIHGAAKRKSGLPRRIRLRSLSYGGQVAPRNDENNNKQ
jgi:hypothetical protein